MDKTTSSSEVASKPTTLPVVQTARSEEERRKEELMQYYTLLGAMEWNRGTDNSTSQQNLKETQNERKKSSTGAQDVQQTASTESSTSTSSGQAPNPETEVEDLVFRSEQQSESRVILNVRRFFR